MTTFRTSGPAAMRWVAVGATASAIVVLGLAGTATAHPSAKEESCATYTHKVGTLKQTIFVYNKCTYAIGFRVSRAGEVSPCIRVEKATYRGPNSILTATVGGWRWTRARPFIDIKLCDPPPA